MRSFQTFDKTRILHLSPASQTSFTPNASSSLSQPGIHNLPGLKMFNTTIIKKAQQRMYFLHQLRRLNFPKKQLPNFTLLLFNLINLFSVHPSLSAFDWPPSRKGTDSNGQLGLQRKSLVPICTLFRTYTCPELRDMQVWSKTLTFVSPNLPEKERNEMEEKLEIQQFKSQYYEIVIKC